MGKAAIRKEANLRKAEKREEQIRDALNEIGGVMAPVMQSIFRYFHYYSTKPRPDLFVDMLKRVLELRLMQLPEHRHAIAGAVASIVMFHPEHQDLWRKGIELPLRQIIESAERLSPPPTDEGITWPTQVEYLWMSWVITRDLAVLQRLVRFASRQDAVGDTALSILHAHAHFPEVKAVMTSILSRRQRDLTPSYRGHAPDVPVAQVNELQAVVTRNPLTMRRVVLVGWIPGETGGYLVVTTDGEKPDPCPEMWHEQRILVRKATPEEMRAHQALLTAAEEP
jgi:hypothetical protein